MSLLNTITGQIVELAVGAEDEFLKLVADAAHWVGLTPASADTGILVAEDLNFETADKGNLSDSDLEPAPVEPTPIPPTETEHG